jgi:glutathione synthase/RimK-type ligase-like ATP-grasp enzyme
VLILLAGIATETPLALVQRELESLGVPYLLFDQGDFDTAEVELEARDGEVTGRLRLGEREVRLEEIRALYNRMMDDRLLPAMRHEPPDSLRRRRCRAVHETLTQWAEIAPGRIVNRSAAMGSNGSKPYQAQVIQTAGFLVPETLVTNDPALVLEFRARHGRIIYKSMSAVRSIVQTFRDEDVARLDQIRWCPTQFQQFVPGTNVRVHVVGEEVIATAIHTDATDYRYARRQVGESADLEGVTISDRLAARCVALARALGLDFAGIDLKFTPEDEVYCFEVNPSPAFSYYEEQSGQPIAHAVARYLAGGSAPQDVCGGGSK